MKMDKIIKIAVITTIIIIIVLMFSNGIRPVTSYELNVVKDELNIEIKKVNVKTDRNFDAILQSEMEVIEKK